uniref:Retrovirus-related Pol polyprotein from transposon opus n=1 Tax=Cajanus cajan TaxID=3821 RepID=A0A151QPQ5_CAJCA|nr:Retrovirus-related Pol polyprotein from transposon opus [Cajanus cajan]
MCDASEYAVGVVLGQRENNIFHVIHYASKVLNETQMNYATTEKELFAIVYALEKFRSHLIGSKKKNSREIGVKLSHIRNKRISSSRPNGSAPHISKQNRGASRVQALGASEWPSASNENFQRRVSGSKALSASEWLSAWGDKKFGKSLEPKRLALPNGSAPFPASKKRKGAASSNPPPHDSHNDEPTAPPVAPIRLDRQRFMTKSKQQRYTELESRQIIAERRVELEAGEYMEFQGELTRRKWNKLATPEKKYHEDIIKEFYANVYPLQRTDKIRNSWVRGAMVSYSRDAINEYLGNPYSLGGDGLDEYGRLKKARAFNADKMAKLLCLPGCTYTVGVTGNPVSFLRKNLTTTTRIWQNFLYCNVYCITHISDLNMPRETLLYSVLQKTGVDIAAIILDEIHKTVLSTPSLTGVSKPLGFPGLITGLCLFNGSRLLSNLNKSLWPPTNVAYIKIHCKSEQQGDASQPRPQRPWQGSSSSLR